MDTDKLGTRDQPPDQASPEWAGRPFQDLRAFVAEVERLGQLTRIKGAHWDLEIGAITEIATERKPTPALLFEQLPDYPDGMRVLTNLISSDAPQREFALYNVPVDLPNGEAIAYWRRQLEHRGHVPPEVVDDGPVMEVVERAPDLDLTTLPWVRWHENDGGRYMCANAAITRDPDSGFINIGSYRFMLIDHNTFVGHLASGHHGDVIRKKYWARGQPCPIAISLGNDPSVFVAAAENLGWADAEYDYAGWLRGAAVKVLPGVASGLPVPATAEAVIEAEMLPPEAGTAIEGPFGEATGYYGGGAAPSTLMRATSIMRRSDPIIMGAPPMLRAARAVLGDRAVLVWSELERLGVPGIVGVSKHWGMTIIAVKQAFPGHAMRAAMGALGGIAGYYGKYVILVDDDINPYDLDEVIWAVATRSQPSESIDILRRTWTNRIDPRMDPWKRERGDLTGSVAIIDATRPFHWRDRFPPTIAMEPELRRSTEAKWGSMLDG